jgi:hydroxyacylglutathione hydrolase
MIIKELVLGPFGTNCYVVGCGDMREAVVIDPADESQKIMNVIEAEDWEVKYILLTHAHIDHVGALANLQVNTGAAVVMHPEEEIILKNVAMQAMMFNLNEPEIPNVDRYVNDGDRINFGNLEFTVLETPGHSPGGISFSGLHCVFVGDVLFAGSIGRTDLPGGSHQTLLNSIRKKLLTLPDDTIIYSGHGPSTTIGEEKRLNPFVLN